MDETTIEDFELILKNKRKITSLYINQCSNNEKTNKPEDVIRTVQSQMSAIQKADAAKNLRKNIKTGSKKEFLTVCELPNYRQEQQEPNINKFETQCVSDTELIELLKNIENDPKSQKTVTPEVIKVNYKTTDDFNQSISEVFDDDNDFNDNILRSQIFEMDQIDSDDDRPSSPVLNFKPRKSPLVFDLDKFERFETIAFSLIAENEDLDKVKYLINSQICGRELNIGPSYCIDKKSPILNIEEKIVIPTATLEAKAAIEDEILFSSDEENDRIIQNLPLTVAIEALDDKNEVLDKSIYVGFQTASNNPIQVAKESFTKAKSILEFEDKMSLKEMVDACDALNKNDANETDKGDNENNNINEVNKTDFEAIRPVKRKYDGFATASNKIIKLSNNALLRSKKVFHDINIDENFDDQENFDDKEVNDDDNKNEMKDRLIDDLYADLNDDNIIKEFENVDMTIKMNDDPMIEDDDIARKGKLISKFTGNVNTNQLNKDFAGFKTANNKQIVISNEALLKSNDLFKDIVNDFDTEFNKENDDKNSQAVMKTFKTIEKFVNVENHSFVGFKTASNKNIEISDDALRKTKNIFNDLDDFSIKLDDGNNSNDFKGFKTASNKNVEISKESLLKTKDIFKDIEVFTEKVDKNTDFGDFESFKTASNKKVEISKEALLKTNNVFKDIDLYIDKDKENADSDGFQGFKTASNKKVHISKEALAKSKSLFKDIDDFTPKENENTNFDGFQGFKTASNKNVEISKEALAKTKNILKDIDDLSQKENKITDFQGFKTASNRNVEISKESLMKTKNIFKNIDDFTEPEKDITDFGGFKTANNKNVNISKESLSKTKDIFKEINNENDCKINSKPKSNFNDMKLPGRALARTKRIFENMFDKNDSVNTNLDKNNTNAKNMQNEAYSKIDYSNDNFLDDKIQEELNETLYTEDFKFRCTSPILSCPKAKRRKIYKETIKYTFKNDYKTTKRYTLKYLANSEKNYEEIKVNFEIDCLQNFVFNHDRNDLTESTIDLKDLENIFLASVNVKLVPNKWIENHLKLILWKLLSYEVKFPNVLGRVCTVTNVIDQLKYRYDKELYNAERSVLRKILEKDDVPSKTMVLCVAGIFCDGDEVKSLPKSSNIELLLTDGWYTIMSIIDGFLVRMVQNGKLVVGTKIMTCGAELLNCEGISPWEDTSSVRLKLCGNSTRRCAWHARLGHHRLRPDTCLRHVDVQGGRIARLKLHVARVYPSLFVEKLEDGSTVTRSERLEQLHQAKHETDRQILLEKIQEEIEKEYYEQESQDAESQDLRRDFESGTQLYRMMKQSKDPSEFRSTLSTAQNKLLQDYLNQHQDRIVNRLQCKLRSKMEGSFVNRNVVGVVRIRVVGLDKGVLSRGTLSIWKPTEDILDIIKEGVSIEVTNVMPTAVRYSEIQLSAGRQSMFKVINKQDEETIQIKNKIKRKTYTLKELTNNSLVTEYNEIDTAGLIVHIDPKKSIIESKMQFQNVYLSDINKNIVCVNFWGGVAKFGYEKFLDTGQIVACVNLQKRAGNTRKNIPQYRATEFSYFTKSPKMLEIRNVLVGIEDSFKACNINNFCSECVNVIENSKNKSYNDITPYKNTHLDMSKKVFETNKNDLNNLSITDSPKTLLRKKQIKEKIEKLKAYGEPPPLSNITILNTSSNAMGAYKSPISVASKENSYQNSRNSTSPIGKTNVNPTKLNFEVREELDSSLPLSLDSI